jgi:hypothetical protein
VMDEQKYPDTDPKHRHPLIHEKMRPWSENQVLHVAVAYTNPRRWQTRRHLACDFLMHMERMANVKLYFTEIAFGDRPFEVADPSNPDHLCLRTPHELWLKENALNLAIQHFPVGWQYGAYCDADFIFTRRDWALEAIHLLQHYHWVQLFSMVQHISGGAIPGEGHQPSHLLPSFALTYARSGYQVPKNWEDLLKKQPYGGVGRKDLFPGAPGGGWAFRKEALDMAGSLMDRCICGSGDSYMAFGLVGAFRGMRTNTFAGFTPAFSNYIADWQHRAAGCHGNIGYVDQLCVHHFHGPLDKRGYGHRDQILAEEKYDPYKDVFPDGHGVLQLTSHKPRLRQRLQEYFRSRCEDIPR